MLKLNKKAFTLIELIVVIAILGLLASIAIPNVLKIREKAGRQVDISNRSILRNAANIAIAENGLPNEQITWTIDNFEKNSSDKYKASDYLKSWPSIPDKKDESYKLTIKENGEINIEPEIEDI